MKLQEVIMSFKKWITVIITAVMLLTAQVVSGQDVQYALDDRNPLSFSDEWLNKDASLLEKFLIGKGYDGFSNEFSRQYGNLIFIKIDDEVEPLMVTTSFDPIRKKVERVLKVYQGNKPLFMEIRDVLTVKLGQPTHRAEDRMKDGDFEYPLPEAYIWNTEKVQYAIHAQTGTGNAWKLQDVEDGTAPFVFAAEIMGKDGVTRMTPKGDGTAKAAFTVAPLITPKPVQIDVAVHSVKIRKNSIGVPKLEIVFINNGKVSIDRFDFDVYCYDAYGNLVKGYDVYDYTECFYDETVIKPGQKSKSNWFWELYGFEGAKSFRIAITKFHTTDGKTVNVPEAQRVWVTYK